MYGIGSLLIQHVVLLIHILYLCIDPIFLMSPATCTVDGNGHFRCKDQIRGIGEDFLGFGAMACNENSIHAVAIPTFDLSILFSSLLPRSQRKHLPICVTIPTFDQSILYSFLLPRSQQQHLPIYRCYNRIRSRATRATLS